MKIIFKKSKEDEISVSVKDGDKEKEFKYIDMIKSLIVSKKLNQPEIHGDFTESEVKSIKSMIKFINDEVDEFYKEED